MPKARTHGSRLSAILNTTKTINQTLAMPSAAINKRRNKRFRNLNAERPGLTHRKLR